MKTSLVRNLYKSSTGRKIVKRAPELLLAGGIVSIIGSLALTVRATLKTQDALDARRDTVDALNSDLEAGEIDEKTYSKELRSVNVKTGVDIAKAATPALSTAAAGVYLITKGHNIQAGRLATVSTALTAANETLTRYRNNVREDLGAEKDQEYMYGRKFEDVDAPTTEVDKKGNPKTRQVKMPSKEAGHGPYSPYAICFDDSCDAYCDNSGLYNVNFLKGAEDGLNRKLHTKGYLLLIEFYEALGYHITPEDPRFNAALTLGWWHTEQHPSNVDFGLFDLSEDTYGIKKDFLMGYKVNVYIEPNIDGYVVDHV